MEDKENIMITPHEVAKYYIELGDKKAHLSISKIYTLAILAGSFIALAAVAANTSSATIENGSIAKILSALAFPGGIIMVIFAGAELFTSDCMMIIATLSKRISYKDLIRSLLWVYLGNFTGALIVAFLIYSSNQLSLFDNALAILTIKTAVKKISLGFIPAISLGILCNFVVCIAVAMAAGVESAISKVAVVYFPIFIFVVGGFEHCVANMYYIPVALFAKLNPTYLQLAIEHGIEVEKLTISNFLLYNMLPVTIGNLIGGVLFVGAYYYMLYLRKAE